MNEKCPHCSFDPTSSGDFCEKHRPKHEWTVDPVGGGASLTPEQIAAGWPAPRSASELGLKFTYNGEKINVVNIEPSTAISVVVEACAEVLGHNVVFGEIPWYLADLKRQRDEATAQLRAVRELYAKEESILRAALRKAEERNGE